MSAKGFMRVRRAAVGVIAAYALVLQAFLAYSIASQAAAQDPTSASGAFFVICSSQDAGGAGHDVDAPVKPKTHCPICTIATSGAALLPDPVSAPAPQNSLWRRTHFATAEACLSFHRARVGLSRAPPQGA